MCGRPFGAFGSNLEVKNVVKHVDLVMWGLRCQAMLPWAQVKNIVKHEDLGKWCRRCQAMLPWEQVKNVVK